MRKISLLLVVLLTMLLVGALDVQAQGAKTDADLYVGIMKFGGVGEHGEGSSEMLFGARYGYNLNANSTIEGSFGYVMAEGGKVLIYFLDYLYNIRLSGNEQITPFFAGGVGAITIMSDAENVDTQTGMTFNVGGGVKYATSGPWGIRVDVKDHIDSWDVQAYNPQTQETTESTEYRNSIEFSGGLTYSFY